MADDVNDGLAEALAATTPPEPAPADKVGDEGGQARDEHGRFAGKEQSEAEGGGDEEGEGGRVPAWRLRELREERDADRAARLDAERRAEESDRRWAEHQRQQREAAQQPRERPDLISDPDGYFDYLEQRVDGRVRNVEDMVRDRVIDMTFADQHETHGKTFEDAYRSLQAAVGRKDPDADRIINAPNPGKALMRWHRNQAAMTEVGGDIEGYKKKLRDEFKKDPEFRKEFMADLDAEARGGNSGRSSNNVTDLPSLNRAPGGGGRQQLGDLGGSDKEIFENLTRKRS